MNLNNYKLNETQGVAGYPYRKWIDDVIELTKLLNTNKSYETYVNISDLDSYNISFLPVFKYMINNNPRKKIDDIDAVCGFMGDVYHINGNKITNPYYISLILPDIWHDFILRSILYHEINHLVEVYHIIVNNKNVADLIDYKTVTTLYFTISNYKVKTIKELNLSFQLTETDLNKLKDLLKILYLWYCDSELNAFVAEFYGKLSKFLPNPITFTEVMKDSDFSEEIVKFAEFKNTLSDKDYVIKNIKPFFVKHIESDDAFYKWIIKAQNERYDKLMKKLHKTISLYNETLQQAEKDEKKYKQYKEKKNKLKENMILHPDIYNGEFLYEVNQRIEEFYWS